MTSLNKKTKFYFLSFIKHDLKASITVFFVALPLCLGVALASNTPVITGLIAGIVGGIIIPLISRSELSVSGPAAGLTAICAAAVVDLGSIEVFFLAVALSGLLQILLGVFKLGGFTHFIPSAVIKGMLTAIGIILISKQIPPLIGYDKPQFWSNELFNIITFKHVYSNIQSFLEHVSAGALLIAILSFGFLFVWNKYLAKKIPYLPSSFLVVVLGILLSLLFNNYIPELQLSSSQLVSIPNNVLTQIKFLNFETSSFHPELLKTAIVICFVATLETLLSLTAIDKLDPDKRVSPQNRELIAQGTGNFFSGLLGGLPITAVIVRSSANAEAGAKTKLSSFFHGIWLLLSILFAISFINLIPYCVLAVLLVRTGYNLAKPKMIFSVMKQGREQFLPFIVTVISILVTDLLIGVLIGIGYAIYYIIKHTYRAGFIVMENFEGHQKHFTIKLALNVSFLNKRNFAETLDKLPQYSVVEIIGSDSVYIDHDVLEIIEEYKSKAHTRHIQLQLKGIPEVEIMELH